MKQASVLSTNQCGEEAACSFEPWRSGQPVFRGEWKALILPEVFEPTGRQSRIPNRRHDRAVAEIGLDGASVVAVVGKLEPACVPQHVRVNEEGEFRGHA